MQRSPEAGISNIEDGFGPYRQVRDWEIVARGDIIKMRGTPMVPQRTYGGRKNRGPLPTGVPKDRRQSHTTTQRP